MVPYAVTEQMEQLHHTVVAEAAAAEAIDVAYGLRPNKWFWFLRTNTKDAEAADLERTL